MSGRDLRHGLRRTAVRRQVGMTTLGMLVLVTFIGMFAFGFIRLTPVYLNYMKVSGVVEGVREEFDGQGPSRTAIRQSIQRRFNVESISEISPRDVTVTSVDGGFEVRAQYEHSTPFIGNISFTVNFDKQALIRR